MIEELRAKDAAWQEQCDGWVANAEKLGGIDTETEKTLRRTVYAEAASALASTQAEILRLKAALEEAERERDSAHVINKIAARALGVSQ